MARVYLSTTLGIAYTNDHPVGTGCPNHRDDVQLVQFFLKTVSEGPRKDQFTPSGQKPLICDGLWGISSQAYLDKFLFSIASVVSSARLKQDGRVDPVRGGKVIGSVSRTVYTILALNAAYRASRGASASTDITTDPLFPSELLPSLKLP